MNYLILLLLLGITITKAFADGYSYRYNVEKDPKLKEKYGIIYHFCYLFLIGMPLLFVFFNIDVYQFLILILGFACVYFGLFSTFYNLITGRNPMYIGETDLSDKWLSKIFHTPTLKGLLFWIRWGIFILGIILIIDKL